MDFNSTFLIHFNQIFLCFPSACVKLFFLVGGKGLGMDCLCESTLKYACTHQSYMSNTGDYKLHGITKLVQKTRKLNLTQPRNEWLDC